MTDKQRAALDKGRRSFKSGDEWSKIQHAKGVDAAVKKRQEASQAKTFAQILAEELNVLTKDGTPRKNGVAKKLVEAIEKAKPKEAAKLFEVLRDTLGEAPSQKIDINANVKTIGNWRDIPTNTTTEAAKDDSGDSDNSGETITATTDESDIHT